MKRIHLIFCLSIFSGITISIPVYADPPSHAPADGWRRKHDPYYAGYNGRNWPNDYGISNGRCNYRTISTVLGGVIGGAVGSRVGNGENRTVAIIIGSVLGAVIGNKIGKELDDGDRGCIGHSLELSGNGRPVNWANPNSGLNYTITPVSGFTSNGLECRNYDILVRDQWINQTKREKACLTRNGNWEAI